MHTHTHTHTHAYIIICAHTYIHHYPRTHTHTSYTHMQVGLLAIVLPSLLFLSAVYVHMYGHSYSMQCVLPIHRFAETAYHPNSGGVKPGNPLQTVAPANLSYFLRAPWVSGRVKSVDLNSSHVYNANTLLSPSFLTSQTQNPAQSSQSFASTSAYAITMSPATWCHPNVPGSCSQPFVCAAVEPPEFGFAHFDHLGGALPVVVGLRVSMCLCICVCVCLPCVYIE
jgi:hypothetical protein